jgi:hypothetical protein
MRNNWTRRIFRWERAAQAGRPGRRSLKTNHSSARAGHRASGAGTRSAHDQAEKTDEGPASLLDEIPGRDEEIVFQHLSDKDAGKAQIVAKIDSG